MRLILTAGLVALLVPHMATAQECEIIGYDQGGLLTFSTANLGGRFTLEFASNVAGPWTNWGAVSDQPITGSVMALPTPMFFRIREVPSTGVGIVSNRGLELYLATRGYDLDGDSRINAEEASRVTQFMFWDWTSMSNDPGTFITGLSESGWGWTTLDFSTFTNAVKIHVTMPSLTNLTVSGLPHLRDLVCENTGVSNLKLENVPSLDRFYCRNNLLTSLDISSNTNLTEVHATGNPLVELVVWWNPADSPPIALTYDGNPTIRNP